MKKLFKLNLSKGSAMLVSTALVLTSFILFKVLGYHLSTIILMIATTLWAGLPIFKKAFAQLRYKIVGIDALVTIAVIGAIIIGEFWEAAAVTYLFMLGDFLEAKTIDKTRNSIKKLLNLAPTVTTIIKDGQEIRLDPKQVQKGDIVVVKPGEKISVDGVVTSGSAYVNQSNVTGESIPVSKEVGENVFSGTVLESGYLLIEAINVGEDTTFARILNMVEEAQDKKAKAQKFIEKFSRYYTPAIIVLSAILFAVKQDIYLALTLLVIACPGALVISTPVSIVAGIGNGAKNGVLFKGGEVIEKLSKGNVVAFDKTGTLTVGKPEVTNVMAKDITQNELLQISAIGESYSEHPLAKAIINKANEQKLDLNKKAEKVNIITGKGIEFTIDKNNYIIGNRRLFEDFNVNLNSIENHATEQEQEGKTVVFVGTKTQVLGAISIADIVRKDSAKLVQSLKNMGIKVVMLTGDNEVTAKAIASQVGITEYYGSLLPQDKVEAINKLKQQHKNVVMVGDGVNDAPALATASLGIAIGGAGKDVAMETADVVVLGERIEKIGYAINLSKATKRNMTQNLVFALITVSVLLTGVLFSAVSLSVGMLVHELSVLLVVLNAIRLLAYGKSAKIK